MPLLTTDTPIDQIILFKEGSISVPPISDMGGEWMDGRATATIPNPLPFRPLPYVEYSLTPDFDNTSVMELVPVNFIMPGPAQVVGILCVDVGAYLDRLEVMFINFNSTTPVTVYYRLYGFAPTDIGSPEVPSTAGLGSLNTPVFNTDLNYMKIVGRGISAGGTVSFSTPISQAWVWEQSEDFIYPASYETVVRPMFGGYLYSPPPFPIQRWAVITSNAIILSPLSGSIYHYRAYS